MNIIDNAISFFSPEAGLRRRIARDNLVAVTNMTTGYDGATRNRERSDLSIYRSLPGYEENVLNAYDRSNMVATLRDMYRNNEICRSVVDRFADYVVHTGIRPQAETSDRDWNQAAEDYFNEWGKVCDYQRRPCVNFTRMQRQCVVDRMIHGESCFVLMETGQLFPVDADRLATPQKYTSDTSVHQGVKASKRGIVEGYFVCNYKPNGMVNKDSFEFYPRENFIHIVWPWRIASQWRGVPELAAIMNKLQDIKSADKYQLLKIKNDAMQFLKHTREGGGGFANASPRNFTRREDSAGGQTVVERHDWGMKWTLSQGEDIQAFESKSPNSQYVPYLEYQARTIGAALGLPFEFVMMLFTNGSFSAQRSALLHAMHKFILWHSEISTMFCARVWNWRIAKAMKEGALPFAPIGKNGFSEWFKCAWSLPETGWVDPEAFIEAERKAWAFGKTSLKKIASSQGQDREEMLTEKGRDIIEAAKVAEQVNRDMPSLGLSWRDIINPDLGSGQPAPANNEEQPPDKPKQETAEK